MKIKESYTLEELCTGLTITLTKFCQTAGITEGTLIRLRQGYAGRRNTINSILATFSKMYGIEFSLENVTGLAVQEKPHQKGKKQPEQKKTEGDIDQKESYQNRIVEPKRTYTHKDDTGLPEGCILATEFGLKHGVKRETFRDHMIKGLGPEKEKIPFSERDRPNRPKEKERFLTPEQQAVALEFWKRHGVAYQTPQPEQEERPWYAPDGK